MSRRGLLIAFAALAMGLAVAWLMVTNDVRPSGPAEVVAAVAIGWSFVASGLVAWRLRPDNSIGPVMILGGLFQLGAGLFWSQDKLLFTIGHLLEPAIFASLIFVLLAFPNGHLETTFDRWLFGATFVLVGPLHTAWLVLGGHPRGKGSCVGCPDVFLELTKARGVVTAIESTQEIGGAVVAVAAIAVLLRRWHRASPRLRFAIAPVLWAGAAALVALLVYMVSLSGGDPTGEAPWILLNFVMASVAMAFLVGVARSRLARSAVADLVIGLGDSPAPGELQTALGRVLHDPSLSVAYWLPDEERYVDARGRSFDPSLREGQTVTMIERDGRRIAALVHDPATLEDEQLVRSVGAAAGLQLENERLQAELRAQLEQVEASRARIVEAAQGERRRIERDLHDGTQQRLVSIAMTLGLADSKLSSDPAGAGKLVKDAKSHLSDALQELRDLSQGIHPGILTERGLPAALAELVQSVRMPIALDVALSERLPDRVEEAAYYFVSEALTNIVKYSHASKGYIQVERWNGVARICVSDDGMGGAEATRGSGLRGLRDRMEALGGQLIIQSPERGGTVVEAEIPCA